MKVSQNFTIHALLGASSVIVFGGPLSCLLFNHKLSSCSVKSQSSPKHGSYYWHVLLLIIWLLQLLYCQRTSYFLHRPTQVKSSFGCLPTVQSEVIGQIMLEQLSQNKFLLMYVTACHSHGGSICLPFTLSLTNRWRLLQKVFNVCSYISLTESSSLVTPITRGNYFARTQMTLSLQTVYFFCFHSLLLILLFFQETSSFCTCWQSGRQTTSVWSWAMQMI